MAKRNLIATLEWKTGLRRCGEHQICWPVLLVKFRGAEVHGRIGFKLSSGYEHVPVVQLRNSVKEASGSHSACGRELVGSGIKHFDNCGAVTGGVGEEKSSDHKHSAVIEQGSLSGHPKPANEGHLKTGQRE